jgi:hypothetical protein
MNMMDTELPCLVSLILIVLRALPTLLKCKGNVFELKRKGRERLCVDMLIGRC